MAEYTDKQLLTPPSTAQYTAVQSTTAHHSPIYPSKDQYSPVQPTTAQSRPVQSSAAQYSPVHPSLSQYSQVQSSRAHHSPLQPSTTKHSPLHSRTAKYSPVQTSTAKYSQVEPTTAQYSPVQPSAPHYSSVQPSCSPVATQYIPVQPVILVNVVKSITLSSLSETAQFTQSCFVSYNALPNNCYGWNQHFWPRFFKHLPYSVVKAGLVKPIGYWAIPTSVGNTMLLMPSGYAQYLVVPSGDSWWLILSGYAGAMQPGWLSAALSDVGHYQFPLLWIHFSAHCSSFQYSLSTAAIQDIPRVWNFHPSPLPIDKRGKVGVAWG